MFFSLLIIDDLKIKRRIITNFNLNFSYNRVYTSSFSVITVAATVVAVVLVMVVVDCEKVLKFECGVFILKLE